MMFKCSVKPAYLASNPQKSNGVITSIVVLTSPSKHMASRFRNFGYKFTTRRQAYFKWLPQTDVCPLIVFVES